MNFLEEENTIRRLRPSSEPIGRPFAIIVMLFYCWYWSFCSEHVFVKNIQNLGFWLRLALPLMIHIKNKIGNIRLAWASSEDISYSNFLPALFVVFVVWIWKGQYMNKVKNMLRWLTVPLQRPPLPGESLLACLAFALPCMFWRRPWFQPVLLCLSGKSHLCYTGCSDFFDIFSKEPHFEGSLM